MVPGPSTNRNKEPQDPFDLGVNGPVLLDHAVQSVRHAVDHGDLMPVEPATLPVPLMSPGACFVTLKKKDSLRGCIGSLEAVEPLAVNVANNAHGAVARDTRFPTVTKEELEDLSVSVSVLSPLCALQFIDEADLLEQLTPGTDGLVIADKGKRSTFLPQVWVEIPDPEAFLKTLKKKGGIATDKPSDTMKAWRYSVTDLGPISMFQSP